MMFPTVDAVAAMLETSPIAAEELCLAVAPDGAWSVSDAAGPVRGTVDPAGCFGFCVTSDDLTAYDVAEALVEGARGHATLRRMLGQ